MHFLKEVHSSGHVCDKCFDPLITCGWPRSLAADTPYLKRSKPVSGESALPIAVVPGGSSKEEGGQCLLRTASLTWAGKKGNSQAAKAETKGRCVSRQALNKAEHAWKLTAVSVEAGPEELVSQSKTDPTGKAALFQSIRVLSQWARREMQGKCWRGCTVSCPQVQQCTVCVRYTAGLPYGVPNCTVRLPVPLPSLSYGLFLLPPLSDWGNLNCGWCCGICFFKKVLYRDILALACVSWDIEVAMVSTHFLIE